MEALTGHEAPSRFARCNQVNYTKQESGSGIEEGKAFSQPCSGPKEVVQQSESPGGSPVATRGSPVSTRGSPVAGLKVISF